MVSKFPPLNFCTDGKYKFSRARPQRSPPKKLIFFLQRRIKIFVENTIRKSFYVQISKTRWKKMGLGTTTMRCVCTHIVYMCRPIYRDRTRPCAYCWLARRKCVRIISGWSLKLIYFFFFKGHAEAGCRCIRFPPCKNTRGETKKNRVSFVREKYFFPFIFFLVFLGVSSYPLLYWPTPQRAPFFVSSCQIFNYRWIQTPGG